MGAQLLKHEPKPKIFRERIGDKEFELLEERLDVVNEVVLWDGNPRLQPYLTDASNVTSEEQLEAELRKTNGYDVLRKSIEGIGQMEPIYVWRKNSESKYLVLEGATRVTILRELALKHGKKPSGDRFRNVVVKILPEEFTLEERVVLLARIHVRGTGVRSWGRYIEAKFIHDNVTSQNGQKPVTTIRALATHMGKSDSWVSRLKDAYEFARRFVEYADSADAEKLAVAHFSTLEEISKATGFGVMVKSYGDPESDSLRNEVFDMVQHDVFKEYRDARFIKNFYDDPEKWAQLKSHEKFIANRLASEEKVGGGSLRGKIEGLPGQIARAFDRDPTALGETELDTLHRCVRDISSRLSNIGFFRLQLIEFSEALHSVTLADLKSITRNEYNELKDGLADFEERLSKYKKWN